MIDALAILATAGACIGWGLWHGRRRYAAGRIAGVAHCWQLMRHADAEAQQRRQREIAEGGR